MSRLSLKSMLSRYRGSVSDADEPTNSQEILEKLKTKIEYIMEFDELDKIVKDRKFLNKIHKISRLILDKRQFNQNQLTFLLYSRLIEHLVLLLELTEECSKVTIIEYYGRKQNINYKLHESHDLDYCLRAYHIFNSLVSIVTGLSDYSKIFRVKFTENKGTDFLLNFLHRKDFLLDCLLVCHVDKRKNEHILNLIKNIFACMHNLNKSVRLDTKIANKIMLSYLKEAKLYLNDEDQFLAYIFLSKNLNERELQNLPDIALYLANLVNLAKISADQIGAERENTVRVECDIDNDRISNVLVLTYKEILITLVELLETIYNLCMNEEIRYYLFSRSKLKEYLKTIILYGNEIEAEYCVKLLLLVSFSAKLIGIIKDDQILMSIIKKILIYQYPNENLKRYSEGLIWKINQTSDEGMASLETIKKKISSTSSSDLYAKKVLISCDPENRDICMSIEKELKNRGYKVWFKDHKKSQYDLDTSLLAIEKSNYILLCTSSTYKLNPICRIEAEFAVELNKSVLPLVMQKDFQFDGWLENITKGKVKISFQSDSFESSFEDMFNRLKTNNFDIISTSDKNKDIPEILITEADELDEIRGLVSENLEINEEKSIVKLIEDRSNLDENSINGSLNNNELSLSNDKNDLIKIIPKEDPQDLIKLDTDVIISNHYKNEQSIGRIKTKLSEWGMSSLTSIENIKGWNKNSITKVLQNSRIILMCITKDYENSVPCKLEAECIFKSGKNFLSIIFDEKYILSDWFREKLIKNEIFCFDEQNIEQSLANLKNKINEMLEVDCFEDCQEDLE